MDRKNLILIILVLTLIIAFSLLYASITGLVVKKNNEAVKIGVILPLTGKTSYVGEWVRQGIELAVDNLKNQGKIVEISYEDDACDPQEAVASINKLVNIDDLKVVLGPVCSSSVLAVAPIAERNEVIIFSTVATSSKITNAGDYVFRNRESDQLHGKTIAEFAFNNLKSRKAGVLFLNLDNGINFKESFKKRFSELGGEVVIEESFEMKDTDYRTQLTKIKQANPDVLYFAGQRMENAVVQAKSLGLNQQILGPSTMQTDSLLKVAGKSAEGIIYTYPNFDPQAPQSRSYNAKYLAKYNEQSEAYASNSYDALIILVTAIEKCKENTQCIKEYLYNIKNYKGVSGEFGFDINGDVERDLVIKTVKDGEFVKYEE